MRLPNSLPGETFSSPVWSPDGADIAVAVISATGPSLRIVNVSTGVIGPPILLGNPQVFPTDWR